MKLGNYIKTLMVIAACMIIAGCADENPSLVYQPPQTETVRVRYLNLAGDQRARTFLINGLRETQGFYGMLSSAIKPPADSGNISVRLNGAEEYALQTKIRFVRNTNYTIVALPSANNAPKQRLMDTLITVASMYGLTEKPNTAYIKILNANPDSTVSYSVNIGCPNGASLFSSQAYRAVTYFPSEIRTGNVAVSLSRTGPGSLEFINLYNLEIKQNRQYTLIVEKNDGREELWMLDELDTNSATALRKLDPESARKTTVRGVNFSTQTITLVRQPGTTIISNLATGIIEENADIDACSSQFKDSIAALTGSTLRGSATLSFEVLQKHTILAFDSTNKSGVLLVEAPPLHMNEPSMGRAIVRVVHGAYSKSSMALTVSMGARNNDTTADGYRSGEVLASNVGYGMVSETVMVPAGRAPLTLFTASQPAQLLMSAVSDFQGDKSYLIIISSTGDGKERISVLEDNQAEKQVDFLDRGVLTEVVNLVAGTENITVSIPGILEGARVNSATSVATVLLPGSYSVKANGRQIDFIIDVNKKALVIAAGEKDNTEFHFFNFDPISPKPKTYSRRFINAAKGTRYNVKLDNIDNPADEVSGLGYGEFTTASEVSLEKKISLFYIDADNPGKLLYRVDELPLTFGKNYNIIFGRNSKGNGYAVVVQQEF
jgi:hypothetical protein